MLFDSFVCLGDHLGVPLDVGIAQAAHLSLALLDRLSREIVGSDQVDKVDEIIRTNVAQVFRPFTFERMPEKSVDLHFRHALVIRKRAADISSA